MWRPTLIFGILTLLAVIGWFSWNQQAVLTLEADLHHQQVEASDTVEG